MANTQLTVQSNINGSLLEKVILNNDLAGLTPIEKVQHVKNVCDSLGLNPLTKPIQLLKFQGKEIPYMTKDATEQLRKNNKVNITNLDKQTIEGIYIVTAYAQTPDGRTDAATGAVSTQGLKGDALCNAMMKAETKAKRRVTLSICGLGFIDESEAETIPNAVKVEVNEEIKIQEINDSISYDINDMILDLRTMDSLAGLASCYKQYYKILSENHDKEGLKQLMETKDLRKSELNMKEFNKEIDEETGEVIEN